MSSVATLQNCDVHQVRSRRVRLAVGSLLGAAAISTSLAAAAADAAGPAEAAEGSALQLEEIVVTSSKRREDLQQVPMSVTALSTAAIRDAGIKEFSDYAQRVPNLTYAAGTGVIAGRTVAIRGVQGANTTGFYIDDMPVPQSLDPRVLDVDRIEILRGPQGTLYGARSMGGTIRLITTPPDTDEFSARTHALGAGLKGGGGDYQFDGSLNAPLIKDTLALRATAFTASDGGYITRIFPDPANPSTLASRRVGTDDLSGGMLSLLWKASDALSVRAMVLTQASSLNGWPLSDYNADTLTQRRQFDIPEYANDRWTYGGVTISYSTPIGDITSTAGYFDRNAKETEDVSEATAAVLGAPLLASPVQTWITAHNFVEEARFLSTWQGPVSFIGGLYYSHSNTQNPQVQYVPGLNAATGGIFGTDLGYQAAVPGLDRERAVFGELTYQLTPQWSVTLGDRYSYIETSRYTFWTGFATGGTPGGGGSTSGYSQTPKAVIKYQVNSDVNVYALAAKGFRPGFGQPAPPPAFCGSDYQSSGLTPAQLSSYGEDHLWNYELGTKTRWLDHRVTLNAAIYQINWTSLQQQSRFACGYTFLVNAGGARSRGGELELTALPFDHLQITAGFGYEHAVITASSPTLEEPVGAPVQQVAPWTASLSAQYTFHLAGEWNGVFRADGNYVDHSFSANENPAQPLLRKSYNLVNLRLGARNDKYEVFGFVQNVGNVHANLSDDASQSANDPGRPRILTNPPRRIGVEVTVRF
jgi:outer membrane receptor protein involved in Fe transport